MRPPAAQVVVVAVETREDRKGRWWARLRLGWWAELQFSDIPTFDSEVAETLPYAYWPLVVAFGR